jgi:tetratricopeptide (TPR) repeat protein
MFSIGLEPINAQSAKTQLAKNYNNALQAVANHQESQALNYLNQAINYMPQFEPAYLLRAKILLSMSNDSSALKDITTALRLNSGTGEANYLQGYYCIVKQQYTAALDNFTKASFLGYKSPVLSYYTGVAHYNNKEYKEAADFFSKALTEKPNQDNIMHDRALCYAKMGDTIRADADFRSAIFLDTQTSYVVDFAYFLAQNKHYGEARSLISGVVNKDTANYQLAVDKANIIQMSGNTAEAIDAYRAILQNHSDPLVWTNLGNSLRLQNQYKPALECFQKAIDLNPNFADAYLYKGLTCESIGEFKQAHDNWQIAADKGSYQAANFLSAK